MASGLNVDCLSPAAVGATRPPAVTVDAPLDPRRSRSIKACRHVWLGGSVRLIFPVAGVGRAGARDALDARSHVSERHIDMIIRSSNKWRAMWEVVHKRSVRFPPGYCE